MYKPAVLLPLIQINLTLRHYSRLHSHTHCKRGSPLWLELRSQTAVAWKSANGATWAVRERIDEGRQIQEKPTFKLKHQALFVRPGGGACGKPSA
jgi:hypothetical protein